MIYWERALVWGQVFTLAIFDDGGGFMSSAGGEVFGTPGSYGFFFVKGIQRSEDEK
jgi:hypothetical protein